jgi:hypothetical protein
MQFVFAVLVLAMTATVSMACQDDFDCQLGSKCVKPRGGGLYGICAGGMSPGNSNDRVPVYDPLDLSRSVGNTCSFDLDCGIGARCAKSGLSGVCVRR